jgi:ankyrin repeat protein
MLLMLHGADGSARKLTGRSALHLAAEQGHLAVVEQLVAGGGVKADWRDVEGNSGLYEAALHGGNTGVALLIQLGSDASIANFWDCAPLEAARRRGRTADVRVLLRAARVRETGIPEKAEHRVIGDAERLERLCDVASMTGVGMSGKRQLLVSFA